MRLKSVLGLSATMVLAVSIVSNVGAASMSEFSQLVSSAKDSLKKAASVRGEWRDSGKFLKKAEAAAKAGKMDEAVKLAKKVKGQGEMGYTQAVAEKSISTPHFMGGPAPKPGKASAAASKFSMAAGANSVKDGKVLAYNRKKGNCLGCHMMDDGVSPGNIGPPLIAMKARYKSKNALRAQIWDASVKNPESLMPPFGRHKALSEADIDKITEYVWSL